MARTKPTSVRLDEKTETILQRRAKEEDRHFSTLCSLILTRDAAEWEAKQARQ